MMQLRPYQQEAHDSVIESWDTFRKVLIVQPTGTGKTIVFCKATNTVVGKGARVLILAHRGELLDQARDKMTKSTGLGCSLEKAESTCIGEWYRITVGSVQTLMNPERLELFPKDYFTHIIVDEAHHALSPSYQTIFDYFEDAYVLGVTATPDRGDLKDLGNFFECVAHEYKLYEAINDGFLVPIKAQTIPIKIELPSTPGEYSLKACGTALDPYLESICQDMAVRCKDKKTVVFTPLIATSIKMKGMLEKHGLRVAEINGKSFDRDEILEDWESGNKYDVLLNSMLLTEGWDSSIVDSVIVLRFTKIRSLYCQMVGRGTRIHGCDVNAPHLTSQERKELIVNSSKPHLMLFDYLFHSDRLDLCRPANLVAEDEFVSNKMTEIMAESNMELDLEDVALQAESDCVADREDALAKQLAKLQHKKAKLVNPVQFELSVQAEDLVNYEPAFGWEMESPTAYQTKTLEKSGILPDGLSSGKAQKIIDRLKERSDQQLSTPKQIRFFEQKGFKHVGNWKFDDARRLTNRIAGNGWRIPMGIDASTYDPNNKG